MGCVGCVVACVVVSGGVWIGVSWAELFLIEGINIGELGCNSFNSTGVGWNLAASCGVGGCGVIGCEADGCGMFISGVVE